MERYINITLDLSLIDNQSIDLRIPNTMTLKEMLQIVFDSYRVQTDIVNPGARIVQTGQILMSTSLLTNLKDGMLIKLETL